MRTNGQIKIARPSWLPLKQGTVSRQSRKRKFPSQLHAFTGSELASAHMAPRPCLCPPRPCMELPPASAGAPHPGLVHAPLVLHRETTPQALLHTWELQRQLSCLRGWPQRPRFPVVPVGHPMGGGGGV